MPIQTYSLTLERAEMIGRYVRHLAFKRTDGEPFNYTPGQFITFHFEHQGKTLRRSYSIASIPGQTDLIEIAVGYIEGGPGTELLHGLQPGDALQAAGPFGRLVLRDEQPQRYIFIATSTGVTPYRAMLPELAQRLQQQDLQVVLLEGVQTREDLLYKDDFLNFALNHPNFEFRAHYSRLAIDNNAEGFEHEGYVQTALSDLQLNPESDIVYLCGNPGMIDDSFEQLKAFGFDPKNVRREKYISS